MARGGEGIARDQFRKDYLKALLAGDRAAAGDVVESLLASSIISPGNLLKCFVSGDGSSRGVVGPGSDKRCPGKLATQITLGQMAKLRLLQVWPRPSAHRVLVCCVEGEEHYIGARMAADLFMMEGWAVDFLVPTCLVRP